MVAVAITSVAASEAAAITAATITITDVCYHGCVDGVYGQCISEANEANHSVEAVEYLSSMFVVAAAQSAWHISAVPFCH